MMRCFPLPKATVQDDTFTKEKELKSVAAKQHPIEMWLKTHQETEFNLSILQQNALSKLIPLLLCGEQSAVHVFNSEYVRLLNANHQMQNERGQAVSDDQLALQSLHSIESDERLHEQALQFILDKLPKSPDQHKIKRSAQQFYANIQQYSDSIAQHFWLISQLDACVCVLMNAVANSSIKHSPLAEVFHLIKKDEARHVKIAKQYSTQLAQKQASLSPRARAANDGKIQHELVQLLLSQSAAFEHLQINSKRLFNTIAKLSQTRRAA